MPLQPRRPPIDTGRCGVEPTGTRGDGDTRVAPEFTRELDLSPEFAEQEAQDVAAAEEAAANARTRRLRILSGLLSDLQRWRRTHEHDGRREAMIFVDREGVATVIDALSWALRAEFERHWLDKVMGEALLIAKEGGAGQAIRHLRLAVDGTPDARRGPRGTSYPLGQLGRDYIVMTVAEGMREFPYMNPTDRALGRPALRIKCPIDPNAAIWRLTKLYGTRSPTATLRLLQRIRTIGREEGVKSEQPFVRDCARVLMDNLPHKWGD
jgi:hypothetical protein